MVRNLRFTGLFPILFGLILFGSCCTGLIVAAENAPQAKEPLGIVVAAPGADDLYKDIRFIMDLAKEPEALKTLLEILDVYLEGADRKKVVVVKVDVDKGEFKTFFYAPVDNMKKFRENIATLDFKSKRVPGKKDLWKISGQIFNGFMRETEFGKGIQYAVFGDDQALLMGKLVDPAELAAPLLKGDYDVAARIVNDPDKVKERVKAFETARKNAKDNLKKKKTENEGEFAIRELWVKHQLNETERFYSESARVFLGWITNVAEKNASLKIDLTPIPGTSLDESAKLLGKAPSYFANYQIDTNAPLSGLINFPLDKIRQEFLQELFKASRPEVKRHIDETKAFSDADKKYAKRFSDLIYDIVDDTVQKGILDTFLDVQSADGGLFTAVGGVKVPGEIVSKRLKELKEDNDKIQLAFDKQGDVEIHSVPLPADRQELSDAFGKDSLLYVGTSKDAAWLAAGPKGVESLKKAIESLPGPVKEGTKAVMSPLVFHLKVSPFTDLYAKHRPEKSVKDEAKRPVTKAAFESLRQGKDTMDLRIDCADDKVEVRLVLDEGLLRFAGKVTAKFVKDNLE